MFIDWNLVATRVDERMKDQGLSCCGIEKLEGAPHTSVDRLRKGDVKNPSFELIMQVCAALRISIGDLFAGAIRYSGESHEYRDDTEGNPFIAKEYTGLSNYAVNLLHWHKEDVHISEFVDKIDWMLIDRCLTGIMNEASRLCAYRESSEFYRSLVKDISPKEQDEIRKELTTEILGEIYKIHCMFDKALKDFAEQYVLHKGMRSDYLVRSYKEKRDGNDPQENK